MPGQSCFDHLQVSVDAIHDDFADRTKTQVVQYVPRSLTVTQAELSGRTTIEAAPNSAQAQVYRDLAERIATTAERTVPEPLDEKALRDWAAGWSHQLLADSQQQVDALPVAV